MEPTITEPQSMASKWTNQVMDKGRGGNCLLVFVFMGFSTVLLAL